MRNTLYRQMVYWIREYRTWIEVVDDNTYKEYALPRNGHIDYIVGDNYAHARATQNVNESFKDTGRVFTLRMDASPFKAGQAYYFRVGAVVDVANAKYNYAPSVRLTI